MESVHFPERGHVYRDYERTTRNTVRKFYRLNHTHQTHAFVLAKKAEYPRFDRATMTPRDALDYLNTLVDDSDPDIAMPQIGIPDGRHRSDDAALGAAIPCLRPLFQEPDGAAHVAELKPYYEDLIARFLPPTLRF